MQRGGYAQQDDPSTEVARDDLPQHGAIDEVPPTSSPLPFIPNDAPTVVRPDLAAFADSFDPRPNPPPRDPSPDLEHSVGGSPIRSSHDDTIATPAPGPQPSNSGGPPATFGFREEPPGDPTVALPPPSQRKRAAPEAPASRTSSSSVTRTPGPSPTRTPGPSPTRTPGPSPTRTPGPSPSRTPGPAPRAQPRDPTPEPAASIEALPGSASYTPPPDPVDPNAATRPRKTLDTAPNTGDQRAVSAKSSSAPKAVKKPPPATGKSVSSTSSSALPKAGNKTGSSKLPKGTLVESRDAPPGGISRLTMLYGAMAAAGVLLVAAAFVIGLVLMVMVS